MPLYATLSVLLYATLECAVVCYIGVCCCMLPFCEVDAVAPIAVVSLGQKNDI